MKKYLFCLALVCLFVSCQNNTRAETTVVSSTSTSSVAAVSSAAALPQPFEGVVEGRVKIDSAKVITMTDVSNHIYLVEQDGMYKVFYTFPAKSKAKVRGLVTPVSQTNSRIMVRQVISADAVK